MVKFFELLFFFVEENLLLLIKIIPIFKEVSGVLDCEIFTFVNLNVAVPFLDSSQLFLLLLVKF